MYQVCVQYYNHCICIYIQALNGNLTNSTNSKFYFSNKLVLAVIPVHSLLLPVWPSPQSCIVKILIGLCRESMWAIMDEN